MAPIPTKSEVRDASREVFTWPISGPRPPPHDDGVASTGNAGYDPEGFPMKKYAVRIASIGGGLVAVLLAGGAWGRG
jgi:hypothetical protein